MVYCIYNANIMSVSQYSKDTKSKKKKLFEEIACFTMESEIKFVRGNKILILVAFENEFLVMHLGPNNALGKQLKRQAESIIGGYF